MPSILPIRCGLEFNDEVNTESKGRENENVKVSRMQDVSNVSDEEIVNGTQNEHEQLHIDEEPGEETVEMHPVANLQEVHLDQNAEAVRPKT